jgi:phosphate transport system protein
MRATFREQLDALRGLLVVMAAAATSAMHWANQALVSGDLHAAARVLETADQLHTTRTQAEEMVHQLLVRQQPVASDLRLALASLHVAGEIERMGLLAQHIAKIMLLRHPVPAVPPEVAGVIARMGQLAESLAWKVARVLELADTQAAVQLDRDDDEMDILYRDLFEVLFEHWPHGTKAAVDVALLSRFYERFADHAVSAGRQVIYLVTGQSPDA